MDEPTYWIDDLPEPLDTAEDVAELFRMVAQRKEELRKEAIERASRN
jgi:hypothetical protein